MFLASGGLLSILRLDHELMLKVRKKHRLTLGMGEGRAEVPGGLHSSSAKRQKESSARGPGAHQQGTGRVRDWMTALPIPIRDFPRVSLWLTWPLGSQYTACEEAVL